MKYTRDLSGRYSLYCSRDVGSNPPLTNKKDTHKGVFFVGGQRGTPPLRVISARTPKCFAFRYRSSHLFAKNDYQSFSLRKNPLGVRILSFINTKKHPNRDAFCIGGQRGIRTLERVLAVTRFPVVRLRPAQPSVHNIKYYNSNITKCQEFFYLFESFLNVLIIYFLILPYAHKKADRHRLSA